MRSRFLPFLNLALVAAPLAAAYPLVRVGLDQQATEWVVTLEGGGEICTRKGQTLLRVPEGEKIRIWWDGRGGADPTEEYRVQVGPPLELREAEALMARLRALGEAPERFYRADGENWRVLTGHFPGAAEAEPLLQKLHAQGMDELWVCTEPLPGKPRKGRALYAVTERYERKALPAEGVLLRPKKGVTALAGKGRYAGRMEIFPNALGRLTVVNTLPMEDYLKGVVPREMGPGVFPALEAVKAQAVAARTYAWSNLGKRAKDGFDLLDTPLDQVYGGLEGQMPMSDRAVAETEGLVATYGGRPIQALFMACAGGATVDNSYVFGGGAPYLKGVSSYAATPRTLAFQGRPAPEGDSAWLSWDLLRLAAHDLIPHEWLDGGRLQRPAGIVDLQGPLEALARRLDLPVPARPAKGQPLVAWMAKGLGLDQLAPGQERPQDAAYFLGAPAPLEGPLASLLLRRGIVSPAQWGEERPTLQQALQILARMWAELESPELLEGTLLLDGQVRPKGQGPGPLQLAQGPLVLAEEAPGGALRLRSAMDIQVGDKVKWMPRKGGSLLLVRRLDPDGASLDRYNPAAHWRVELKDPELLDRVRHRAGGSVSAPLRLEATHNAQGRVTELAVRDGAGRVHRFTGMRIRGLLGLKDNVFRFIAVGSGKDRRWLFYGRGNGHGVGMDQTGAYGMALEGKTFQEILRHYYTGIELKKME